MTIQTNAPIMRGGHDIVCLLVSFSITKIQQLFETTKFILTFL